MVVPSCLIITQCSGNCQMLRASIEYDPCLLTVGCSNKDSSYIKSIILTFKINPESYFVLQISSQHRAGSLTSRHFHLLPNIRIFRCILRLEMSMRQVLGISSIHHHLHIVIIDFNVKLLDRFMLDTVYLIK